MQNISTSELLFGLALAAPLISFLLCFSIPERYSWLASIVSSACMFIGTIVSVMLFFSGQNLLLSAEWFTIGSMPVYFAIELDSLSRIMVLVVSVISWLVHIYSAAYMAGDSAIRKYFAILGFFTFAMLGIVVSANTIILFVFWELVGFSSYLLIGHWLHKPAAGKAAQKAFLLNRIGDAALLVGILMLWTNSTQPPDSSWMTITGLCIFGGVIAKSAQLPLFSWLPDAMEGPTPVSALLHAATMVAAGVILLLRLAPIFNETTLLIITITGSATALFAAVCALNQFDIKKILAYSTISQLGLMVTAVGMRANDAALLHLFTHAFCKAGLFLAAGSVMHALQHQQQQAENKMDVQDIRNLGGLRKKMPFTFLVFCITGASLAGLPLFSGFISKDSILEAIWIQPQTSFTWVILIASFMVSFLTALYTFRVIRFIFLGEESNLEVHESPWAMRAPMILLAFASCWIVVSRNPISLNSWFAGYFNSLQHATPVAIISGSIALLGLILGYMFYMKRSTPKAIPFIQNGFGLDSFYQNTIGTLFLKLSAVTESADKKWIDGLIHFTAYVQVSVAHGIAWFDRNVVDGFVHAGAWLAKSLGSFARSFQSGKIQLYIFWAVAGLIIFLFFVLI